MYPIVQAPKEILRQTAKPVDPAMPGLEKIIADMKQTLLSQDDPEGVGLAANQVGLPYRLFLARFSTKKTEPVRVFLNPEIVEHSQDLITEDKKTPLEGCLSLPAYYGIVKRWKWVKVKYQTISNNPTPMGTNSQKPNSKLTIDNWNLENGVGNWIIDRFDGFPATVVQHELDHIDGRIFVERILEQKGKLYKVTGKDKKGKEMWEEVEL